MRRLLAVGLLLAFALPLSACTSSSTAQKDASTSDAATDSTVTTPSGLKYIDLVAGKGPMPKVGQTISVLYTGRLPDGTVFDSTSKHNNEPFETPIGVGQVIKGWDEGMLTMRVGGKRRLTIPPELGYGDTAQGPIPANSTLIFDVELLAIK